MAAASITVSELINYIVAVGGLITACGLIYGVFHKIKSKTVDETIEENLKPIKDALREIKNQNKKIGEEMMLILKIQQAMTQELEEKGAVNGKTQNALNELNEYLLKSVNE